MKDTNYLRVTTETVTFLLPDDARIEVHIENGMLVVRDKTPKGLMRSMTLEPLDSRTLVVRVEERG